MSGDSGTSASDISSVEAEKIRPKSEAFQLSQAIEASDVVTIPAATPAPSASPRIHQQPQTSSPPQTFRRRSSKPDAPPDKKRSMSLTSFDDLKTPKPPPGKSHFFVRLGRSWSRRLSAAA